MKALLIYDKAMCCSTGVCGPQVDPILARFAADIDWIGSHGVHVDRFNLGQQTTAFIENPLVNSSLQTKGVECLPLIVVDDQIVSEGKYPSRESLAKWAGIERVPMPQLVISDRGGCCGDLGCC